MTTIGLPWPVQPHRTSGTAGTRREHKSPAHSTFRTTPLFTASRRRGPMIPRSRVRFPPGQQRESLVFQAILAVGALPSLRSQSGRSQPSGSRRRSVSPSGLGGTPFNQSGCPLSERVVADQYLGLWVKVGSISAGSRLNAPPSGQSTRRPTSSTATTTNRRRSHDPEHHLRSWRDTYASTP